MLTPLAEHIQNKLLRGMGSIRIRTLTDLARRGYFLKLVCACGHSARIEPLGLAERLSRRSASLALDRLTESLKCQKCGGNNFDAIAVLGDEIWS